MCLPDPKCTGHSRYLRQPGKACGIFVPASAVVRSHPPCVILVIVQAVWVACVFLLREPVFLRQVGVAWYGTLTAVVLYSTFEHLLQGFRAPHALRQALGKKRGKEIASCTETPALESYWT